MSNQVATQNQQRQQVLTADQFRQELTLAATDIEKMLPAHVKFDKFQGMVINAVINNQYLMKCSQQSLIRAVIDAADLGLSLNPTMREADILPVWSQNGYVAQCRPRAIGMMKLARQSGEITKIAAHEVYENDAFDYSYEPEVLTHKPPRPGQERGHLIAAYCIWTLKDGPKQFEVIDQPRIDRAKASSESWKAYVKDNSKKTPWMTDEAEMWRKTAVRAASKYFPNSTENESFLRAMGLDNEIQGEFNEVQAGEGAAAEPQGPQSGATQVASLEARLGVQGGATGEPGGPEASSATAPAAGAPAAPTGTPPSQPPSGAPSPAASQAGGATTASRSRTRSKPPAEAQQPQTGPVGPEPPPPEESDYGARASGPVAQESAGAAGPGQVAPKAGSPMQDLAGDDLGDPIDFPAEARAMRARMIDISDIAGMKAFIDDTKPVRQKMKTAAPEWYGRIMGEIVRKEEALRAL